MAKNEKEKWIFENFKKLFLDFPDGEIDCGSESPDFLIKSNCVDIGVEVTELFREQYSNEINVLQESESIKHQISERLMNRLEESDLKPMLIGISLLNKAKLTKNILTDLVDKLFDFVCENQPSDNSVLKIDDLYQSEMLREFVNSIRICHSYDNSLFDVSIASVSWLPNLSKNDIEAVIAKKELKRKKYLQRARTLWLLIAIDTSSLATFYRGYKSDLCLTYESKFDRIFVISVNRGELFELNVKKPL